MTKIKNFFKSITNSKKKVFALALSVCVVVLSIASSSIAYFTDTAKFTNTFTAGNVKIQLSEAEIQKNATTGDVEAIDAVNNRVVATNVAPQTQEYGSVFPKQHIAKDPKITNIGSENAYIGAIVTITSTDIDGVLVNETAVRGFVENLPEAAIADVKIQVDTDEIKIYVVYKNALAKNGEVFVFNGIQINKDWTNDQMSALNGLKIVVDAYAVQTAGMGTNPLAALQEAFNEFDSVTFS